MQMPKPMSMKPRKLSPKAIKFLNNIRLGNRTVTAIDDLYRVQGAPLDQIALDYLRENLLEDSVL